MAMINVNLNEVEDQSGDIHPEGERSSGLWTRARDNKAGDAQYINWRLKVSTPGHRPPTSSPPSSPRLVDQEPREGVRHRGVQHGRLGHQRIQQRRRAVRPGQERGVRRPDEESGHRAVQEGHRLIGWYAFCISWNRISVFKILIRRHG